MPYQAIGAQQVNVDLYTSDGKWVRNLAKEANLQDEGVLTFEVSDLASGIYYLQVRSEDGTLSKGFVVR